MLPVYETHNLVRFTRETFANQATTDAYVDLDSAWAVENLRRKTVVIENTGGTNAAHARVLGSVDGGTNYDVEIQPEASITAGGTLVVETTSHVTHIKIQVKAATAGAQTNVEARAAASTN